MPEDVDFLLLFFLVVLASATDSPTMIARNKNRIFFIKVVIKRYIFIQIMSLSGAARLHSADSFSMKRLISEACERGLR